MKTKYMIREAELAYYSYNVFKNQTTQIYQLYKESGILLLLSILLISGIIVFLNIIKSLSMSTFIFYILAVICLLWICNNYVIFNYFNYKNYPIFYQLQTFLSHSELEKVCHNQELWKLACDVNELILPNRKKTKRVS